MDITYLEPYAFTRQVDALKMALTLQESVWQKHRCPEISSPSSAEILVFESVLNDARDERPLQDFLGKHPQLLSYLLPAGRAAWCFDRPRFGAELIPDFLLVTDNSAGMHWCMLELESPNQRPLTQGGMPSQKLNHALLQVRDWRIWLRSNIAYAQNELGFKELSAECEAIVIIGRRHTVDAKHAVRYRELSNSNTTVMSYDRLLDMMRRGRTMTGAPNDQ